jgi:hypothetical protein
MVKSLKRAVAALLAVVMMVSVTACSTDKSWAMKNDTLTAPIGAYIYYLYAAYQSASSSVKDTTKPVLDQQIDGKNAETWIKEKALNYTKMLFLVNDKMKELKLTLTDAETKSNSDTTDSTWEQYGTTLEKYGISKSSLNLAYSDYYAKYQKIFTATYGKGGPKAVSDADLKTYFEKNYTDFSFVYKPLSTTDASGNATALSAAETAAVKKEFDAYAADVKSGKKTMQQIADAYKSSSKATTEQLQSDTAVLSTSSSYPAEFVTLLQGMKPGEVKSAEISGTYFVIMKNDITKKTATQLSTDSGRDSVIVQMKGTEYSEEMDKESAAYTKVTLNQAALDSYKPSMFVTVASSEAAATASTAATASAAAAASSK